MDAAAFVTAQEEAAADGPWAGVEGFPPPPAASFGPRRRGSSGTGRTSSGGGEAVHQVVMMHNAAEGVRGTSGDEAGGGRARSLDVELGARQHTN